MAEKIGTMMAMLISVLVITMIVMLVKAFIKIREFQRESNAREQMYREKLLLETMKNKQENNDIDKEKDENL